MPEATVGTSADTVSVTDPATPQGTPQTQTTSQGAPDTVIVTIDGQQVAVPYDEVIKGYQRQADYTRKTQALSAREQELADAEQLWQAFQADPQRTIQVLTEYYGAQDAGTAPDANSADPQEARLAALEAQQAEIAQQALIAEIEDAVDVLREEYGDIDRDELLQYAVDNEIPNLRAALLDMREEQARQQSVNERNREVIARKAGTVTAGRSRVGNDAIGREAGPINSVGDALAEAMAELGLDSIPSF